MDDSPGAWEATATMDWCESNYAWSFYIAEWWNTVSNLVMILLGLHGAVRVLQCGGEQRFMFAYLGLTVVGLGSCLFHMTLSLPMQFVDELSMLFTAASLLFCAMELKSPRGSTNRPLAIGLGTLTSLLSVGYIIVNHPVLHQVMYAMLLFSLLYKTLVVLREYPRHWQPLATGVVLLLAATFVWKVDVHYCQTLRDLRAGPGKVAPGVLEFHAWWHAFAGLGAHSLIVAVGAIRSDVIRGPMGVRYLAGVMPMLTQRTGRYE